MCPRSLGVLNILGLYIKCVKDYWTNSMYLLIYLKTRTNCSKGRSNLYKEILLNRYFIHVFLTFWPSLLPPREGKWYRYFPKDRKTALYLTCWPCLWPQAGPSHRASAAGRLGPGARRSPVSLNNRLDLSLLHWNHRVALYIYIYTLLYIYRVFIYD